MAKNILVLSCDFRETRAALIEDGIIAELHIERKGRQSSTVGNVYLGKVTRVLPGLQAAFIDIGQERAAFLHVEDLIRPDDFDEYLAGGRKLARTNDETVVEDGEAAEHSEPEDPTETTTSASDEHDSVREHDALTAGSPEGIADEEAPPSSTPALVQRSAPPSSTAPITIVEPAPPISVPSAPESSLVPVAAASGEELLVRPYAENGPDSGPSIPSSTTLDELPIDEDDEDEDEHDEDLNLDEDDDEVNSGMDDAPRSSPLPSAASEAPPSFDEAGGSADTSVVETGDDDDLDLPGFTVTDPGEPVPRAPAPARADERGGRRRRRGRGRGGERPSGDAQRPPRGDVRTSGRGAPAGGAPGGGGSRGQNRDRRGGRNSNNDSRGLPGRISKTTPIREVVREGQEIIVQVTKDPIGTKGARCSSHVSLPGRYVVYLPTVDHIGISKRIGSDRERARLREAIEAMKPPSGGLIVRTVAEGLTKKGLKQDVGYLVRLWGEIAKKREGAHAPCVLSSELDLVLKVARDLFTDDVDEVVIDDKQQYERLCRFVEMFAPDRVKDVKFYDEDEPIFDEYGIEDEIQRALSRKVPLPSGGHLIIDQAEALTAIDVNTGRFVGKGSKDMEETILKTNLEAVNEIAYQLRFRNIGGLIILDLIDMELHKNREKVRRTLEELLQKDKAKTTLNRISELGLIEMTRKRTRESLGRMLHEPCFYCDGTGQLQSKETIAYEVLRELRRKKGSLPGYSVIVNAHPAVADVLNGPEKLAVTDAENKYMRKILVVPRKEYHLEQFDLVGK